MIFSTDKNTRILAWKSPGNSNSLHIWKFNNVSVCEGILTWKNGKSTYCIKIYSQETSVNLLISVFLTALWISGDIFFYLEAQVVSIRHLFCMVIIFLRKAFLRKWTLLILRWTEIYFIICMFLGNEHQNKALWLWCR